MSLECVVSFEEIPDRRKGADQPLTEAEFEYIHPVFSCNISCLTKTHHGIEGSSGKILNFGRDCGALVHYQPGVCSGTGRKFLDYAFEKVKQCVSGKSSFELKGECSVAPRLPRDVRVQSDKMWVIDKLA